MTPFEGKLRIRHLEIILAVAELGNLSKVAEQFQMTQSGLSRSLIDIEDCVGGQLFERTPKGMKATTLGSTLCLHAGRLLADYRRAQTDVAAVLRGDQGSLNVGCFALFSHWPLPETISRFRRSSPNVSLNCEIGAHEDLIGDLDSGALDVLLSRSPPGLDPTIYRIAPLLNDPVVLACSAAHPLVSQELPQLTDCVAFPWVTALPGGRIRLELDKRLRELGHGLPPLIGALSVELGKSMIQTNEYLWMLPGCVAASIQAKGQLRILPIDLHLTRSPLCAIWRRDKSSTRHVRAFVSLLNLIIDEAESLPESWRLNPAI